MSGPDADVAIVGGGIIGAACAYWASRAGRRVVAVERSGIAAGSTGAGTGHIVVLDHRPELLALTAYSRRLWQELGPTLPADVRWRTPGTIWLADTPADADRFDARRAQLDRAGVRAVELDGAHLHRLEPALASSVAGGLWVRDDALLDPAAAARALWASARASGARLEIGAAATGWTDGGVALDDGRSVTAPQVVIAAGTGTPRLAPEAPVLPRKGHVLRLAPGLPALGHVLIEAGYGPATDRHDGRSIAFNAQPDEDGAVLLGASREPTDDDRVDPGIVAALRERARAFAPSLAKRAVASVRVGIRPATEAGVPWIGPLPGGSGRWVAAGHEGLGVTTALGTGRLLVDLIIGERPALPMEPYRPGRAPRPSAAA